MKVQTAKRMLKMQEWAMQVNACEKSGQTVKKWCEENGINPKTFYNRRKVVQEEMLELVETANTDKIKNMVGNGSTRELREQSHRGILVETSANEFVSPVFAALPMPQSATAAISVRINSCVIDVQNSVDAALLEQVLRMVVHL